MSSQSVREQFGANARFYVTHETHAKGASLQRLVDVVPLEANWQALDVATGAGHTAFALAPHVARVTATDITPEMLDLTRAGAAERGLENVQVEAAAAEDLAYATAHFDCITCRIAAHHFEDVPAFLTGCGRILKAQGYLVIIDNVVPEGVAGDFVNAFEKLRDPSHRQCLSISQWQAALADQELALTHLEILGKRMKFDPWASRHDAIMQGYLRALLDLATGPARGFLQPRREDGGLTFGLQEGFMVARKRSAVRGLTKAPASP